MTVYNTELYLKDAIESILSQSFSDFELVIVDDGSTDHCPQILNDFCLRDSRIKVITQKNSGIGAATQRAISECCGQYIVIMDSDDISLPQRLALQKKYLDQHPDIDAVGSQWQMLGTNGENIGTDTHPTDSKTIKALMFAYFSLHHPTTMIRKSAIEKVGGYSVDRSCLVPDYEFFMRLQLNGSQFANLPQILFLWRLNPASTTHSKALQQTDSVYHIRETGFATFLNSDPDTAKTICKEVVYNFPIGTWQDHKITQLLPNHDDSLLYKTWLSLPTITAEEKLFRAIVLWLRDPGQNYSSLSAELQSHQLPWLASLVNAYHGKGKALLPSPLGLSVIPSPEKDCLITLFIPYVHSEADFSQRLDQAQQLQFNSNLPIELLVFSASEKNLPVALIADNNFQFNNLIVHESPFAWELALNSANGHYFIYLEENYRFHIERLISIIQLAVTDDCNLLYLLDTRYLTEAVNEEGLPLLDDSPSPSWTRSTLLGKDRIALTGFIHKRSLLKDIKIKLDECGTLVSRVLAKHLAIHHSFTIHQGIVDYFIPPTALSGTPLPILQQTILDWFVDFGMTHLPTSSVWSQLSIHDKNNYACALSDAWIKNNLFIFPGNENTIKKFYLENISNPLHFPLFRHLLVHNKKTILTFLWQKKKTKLFLTASIVCIKTIIRNRLSGTIKK